MAEPLTCGFCERDLCVRCHFFALNESQTAHESNDLST